MAILVIAVTVSLFASNVSAQEVTKFSTADQFSIPELNGSLQFAFNGSYSSAGLENNTWTFRDLTLNGSAPLGNLKVSVQNSNITIYSFYAYSAATQSRQAVRYNAQGAGQQVFNLAVNGTTDVSEWWVTLPGGVFLAEGKDWNLQAGNTVAVNGQTGNVSVVHFDFGVDNTKDLPLLEAHSVALLTVAALAVTVTAAALVSLKRRRH